MAGFGDIPDEMVLSILSHLPARELLTASFVCHRWFGVATSCASTLDIAASNFVTTQEFLLFLNRFKNCYSLELAFGGNQADALPCSSAVLNILNGCCIRKMTCSMRVSMDIGGVDFMRNASTRIVGLQSLRINELFDDFYDFDSLSASLLNCNGTTLQKVEIIHEAGLNRMFVNVATAMVLCCSALREVRLPILNIDLVYLLPLLKDLTLDCNTQLQDVEVTQVHTLKEPFSQVKNLHLNGNMCSPEDNVNVCLEVFPSLFPNVQTLHVQGVCWQSETLRAIGEIESLHFTVDARLTLM